MNGQHFPQVCGLYYRRLRVRSFFGLVVVWTLGVTLSVGPSAFAAELPALPNIVLVITDDQGYGEIAAHGNSIIKTPNLDRLHAESVRFTDFHVSPTCSPTRASLMTGRHEFRSGITHTINERERLALSATTIAQVLQSAGYATGIFGKWHLGDEAPYQPNKRGFEEVFIHGAGGIGQSYPGSCGDAPGNTYFEPYILHNGVFEKTQGYCTNVFFNRATSWIDKQRQANRPFFAYIATNAPHGPYIAPPAYAKPYLAAGLAQDAANYYGMVTNIDDNIGRLREQLKAWDIDKNTLFLFMTDNGHSMGKLYNAGMRGQKGTPYQGGTRVPLFMHWPAALPSGVDIPNLTAHIDLFPTFAAIAGAKIPAGIALDGRSLTPLLRDRSAPWPDRNLYVHVARWEKGKAEASKFAKCAVRTKRFRFVNNSELFDIQNDPGEMKNVVADFPQEVAKLRADYDRWWSSIQPGLINENVPLAHANPFKEMFEKQFGKPAR